MDSPFEEHFADLWRIALRVAYRLGGPSRDPEGVAADTLTEALRSWSKVRDPQAWVATVAARRVMRTRPARPSASRHPDPVAADVERIDLVRALRRLPRRQRETIVLRYIADLPDSAVAERLGVSVSAVKAHTARALDALRRELRQSGPPADPDTALPRRRLPLGGQ